MIDAMFVIRQVQEKFRVKKTRNFILDLWIWKRRLIAYQEK